MRSFSEKEKNYISRICEATRNPRDSFFPVNLLFDYLYNNNACYITGTNYLEFDRNVGDVIVSELIAIENTILELTLLLEYLEKNGLLVYVKDQSAQKGAVIGKVIKGGIKKITAPIITEQLTKASSFRIVVGQTLRDLVTNDFKTNEDLMLEAAKEQSKLAQRSLDEAREQSRNASKALIEAEQQTQYTSETLAEAKKQTELAQLNFKEVKEQTDTSLKATAEAHKQTNIAIESLKEAQKQSNNAAEALKEARKQTKWANLNSFLAFLAIVISILTFCLNRCSTNHVIVDECHFLDKSSGMIQQPTEKDTSLVTKSAHTGTDPNVHQEYETTIETKI